MIFGWLLCISSLLSYLLIIQSRQRNNTTPLARHTIAPSQHTFRLYKSTQHLLIYPRTIYNHQNRCHSYAGCIINIHPRYPLIFDRKIPINYYQNGVMQLNHDDLDHTTLHWGGGYIVDCWITTKTCATRSPTPPPNITITSYHPQKSQKMINILIPTSYTILSILKHHYHNDYCCIKYLLMLLCPREYPYTTPPSLK